MSTSSLTFSIQLVLRIAAAMLCCTIAAIAIAPLLPGDGMLLQVTATLPQRLIYRDMRYGITVDGDTLDGNVTSVVAAPDDHHIALSTFDREIIMLDVLNGDSRTLLPPHPGMLLADWHAQQITAISPDGVFTIDVNTGAFTPLRDDPVRYIDTSVDRVFAYTTRGGLYLQPEGTPRGWMLRRSSRNSPVYSEPTFSPDGGMLAFVSDSHETTRHGIFVYNLEDETMHKITRGTFLVVNRPTWSPDGTRLVYQHMTGRESHLVMMNIETGVQTTLGQSTHSMLLAWMR